MQKKSLKNAIIEKSILKSILPYIGNGDDWASNILYLGRINAVAFQNRKEQKKPKCIFCGTPFQNYLLFVLHLELIHKDDILVQKYQFSQNVVTIFYRSKDQQYEQQKKSNEEYFLGKKSDDRVKDILISIFSKFVKPHEKQKRKYFHSADIFKEVGEDSQGEDSQEDLTNLQRQLQRMRISEFTDVNQGDKAFFIQWNDIVHDYKKINGIMDHSQIIKMLDQFAVIGKKQGVKRINMVMHGWTLWSSGKINADEVQTFLKRFDETEIMRPE